MKNITEITLAAVRNGEQLDSIRDRVLVGIINSALIKNCGNQTQVAKQLGMSRYTIRLSFDKGEAALELGYKDARHYLSRVAVMEAIKICGDNRTLAEKMLDCSKYTAWRYSREHG